MPSVPTPPPSPRRQSSETWHPSHGLLRAEVAELARRRTLALRTPPLGPEREVEHGKQDEPHDGRAQDLPRPWNEHALNAAGRRGPEVVIIAPGDRIDNDDDSEHGDAHGDDQEHST